MLDKRKDSRAILDWSKDRHVVKRLRNGEDQDPKRRKQECLGNSFIIMVLDSNLSAHYP